MDPTRLPRRFVARAVVCLWAAFILPAMATAANTTFPIAPIALRSALKTAWQKHPSYQASESRLAAARAHFDAASQPLYNPELEFAADEEGPDRSASVGINLTLDLTGKRRTRQDAAFSRIDLATAEARLRRRDFIQLWLSSWAELQTAQRRVDTGQRRLALIDRFADLANKQFEAGDISGLERDLAQLARDEAQADQSQLDADRAQAEARFRNVGGIPELATLKQLPTDSLSTPEAGAAVEIEQLPEWQVAQAEALATDREVSVARSNRRPDPTIGLRGGRIDYGPVQDNVVGLSVSIPLFVRNSYRAEIVAAQADADAAQAEAQRVRLEAGSERRRAIDSYRVTHAAWTRWQASRGTDIERRTSLLERLWQQGELSTADYLLQLKQTLDTQLAGAELEARLWRSYADYLAATGRLERWAGMEQTP
ncbi:MAG: TolC family protein [Lysobacteraceae bacterium]